MMWPSLAKGMKIPDPPLGLGLKYHDPPPILPSIGKKIPANPAYGVYISQLVRYVRICTLKLDFIRRLRRLSSRLLHQGFKSTLLHKSFTKFFKHHSAIIEKYGTTLREIRLAIQNWDTPLYPLLFQILYIILAPLFYFSNCFKLFPFSLMQLRVRAIFLKLCAWPSCALGLFSWRVCFI